MKRIMLLFSLCIPILVNAQNGQEEQVVATIKTFFDGMRETDSIKVRSVLHPAMRLQTTGFDQENKPYIREVGVKRFLESVGTPKEKPIDERIWSYDVRVDDNLATAWTEYSFFVGDQLSHCGVNAFQLAYIDGGWKVTQITDTRRKTNCKREAADDEKSIHNMLEAWHLAAGKADENAFFAAFDVDAIYLGTDASESWTKEEFMEWSKSAFSKDVAWDFKPIERRVYLAAAGGYGWFDEKLETWMGMCRGSGVVQKTSGGWKIKHYNLAVTVPNELVKEYIKLLKKE